MKAYSDLNAIEKKIRDKAVDELYDIAKRFEQETKNLCEKYGITHRYYSFDTSSGVTCMNDGQLREQIFHALKHRCLEKMMAVKSQELLDKLELL